MHGIRLIPHHPARIPRHRRAVAHETALPAAATTEAVREGRTSGIGAGRRQGREAATRNDLPVHGLGRLHAVTRAPPLSTTKSAPQPRLLPPGASGVALSDSEAPERSRRGVSTRVRARPPGRRRPASLYQAETAPTEREVERSHRIDDEEFWSRHSFAICATREAALRAWEHRYHYERFSLSLDGRTPAEKLRDLQAIATEREALSALLSKRTSTPFTCSEGRSERAVLA